jgi:D-alanyl-D-alanine dipeptidase
VFLRYVDPTIVQGIRYGGANNLVGRFDVRAHIAARSIASAQRRWRNLLVAAMAKQGFVNYSKEWWHYSLPGAQGPAYDFPIRPRCVYVRAGVSPRKLVPE